MYILLNKLEEMWYNNTIEVINMEITKNKEHLILHDKNIVKGILLLALPVMLNNIIKAFHDVVDTFLVSQINAPEPIVSAQIAAIGFVSPIMTICQALAIGMMTAGTALMSQYIGAKKEGKAAKVSGQLLMLCGAVGVIFNILLYFLAPYILNLMDAQGSLYTYSLTYIRIRSFELTGLFIFYAYQATRQSQGDTLTPVIINGTSIIINIVLTIIFIFGMKMDLSGAAIGTVIANMIIIPACIIHMIKNKSLPLSKETIKPDWKYSKKIFSLGAPAAISQAFTSLAFLIINGTMSTYENTLNIDYSILAPISIGGRINSLLLFPVMGIGTVLATFVGQNIGAGNKERAKNAFRQSLLLVISMTTIGAILLFPFRELLTKIFLSNPDEIALCSRYVVFLLIGLPLMGVFQCFIGCFQGAGRTDLSLWLSTIRLWVLRIPVLLIMVHFLNVGYQSVWICMTISNFGAMIVGCILYRFVDYEPRTSKLQQKVKKEVLEVNNG